MMAHGPPEAPIKSTQQLLDWTGLDQHSGNLSL
jgi:hypothetical protein